MSETAPIQYCGRCFKRLTNGTGTVLSCGDFLCVSCESSVEVGGICQLCRKSISGKVKLNAKDKPEEISRFIADTADMMETLYSALEFQVKGYKRIIKKLLADRSDMQRCDESERFVIV